MDIINRFFSPRKNGTDTNNNTSVDGAAVTTEEMVDTVDAEPPKRKILASDSRTATDSHEDPYYYGDEGATTAAATGEQPPPVTKKLKTKNDKEEEKDGNKNVTLLQGKIILVTGANRGIGKAFVDTLLQYGATKIYAGVRDVQQTKRNNIFNDPWYDERVEPIYLDMREATSIANAAAVIGPLDMVINNAGILSRTRTLDDNCIAQLQQEMDVNVYGMVRLMQQFAPLIRATPSCPGVFVQLNSVSSIRCAPELATYSASKAASFALTQALRKELHETYGDTIHVLSIHPGPIDTDMLHGTSYAAAAAPPPSLVAERFVEALLRHHARDATHSPLPFLLYPDAKAKTLGTAYHSYAEIVHEQKRAYG